jgi:hypothetical protein
LSNKILSLLRKTLFSEEEMEKHEVAEFLKVQFSAKYQKTTVSEENERASKRGRRRQVKPSERLDYPNIYIL